MNLRIQEGGKEKKKREDGWGREEEEGKIEMEVGRGNVEVEGRPNAVHVCVLMVGEKGLCECVLRFMVQVT